MARAFRPLTSSWSTSPRTWRAPGRCARARPRGPRRWTSRWPPAPPSSTPARRRDQVLAALGDLHLRPCSPPIPPRPGGGPPSGPGAGAPGPGRPRPEAADPREDEATRRRLRAGGGPWEHADERDRPPQVLDEARTGLWASNPSSSTPSRTSSAPRAAVAGRYARWTRPASRARWASARGWAATGTEYPSSTRTPPRRPCASTGAWPSARPRRPGGARPSPRRRFGPAPGVRSLDAALLPNRRALGDAAAALGAPDPAEPLRRLFTFIARLDRGDLRRRGLTGARGLPRRPQAARATLRRARAKALPDDALLDLILRARASASPWWPSTPGRTPVSTGGWC